MKQSKLFVSYRREDSSGSAGRLYDRLTARFGHDQVFMDVDSIQPGGDFVESLTATMKACDAVLVVIGRHWVDAVDVGGSRRLNNPADFVRSELLMALECGLTIIPVLVSDARMPTAVELPDALQWFARKQAVEIRDLHFHRDVDHLVESLNKSVRIDTPAGEQNLPREAEARAIVRSTVWFAGILAVILILIARFASDPSPYWAIELLAGVALAHFGFRFRLLPATLLGGVLMPVSVICFGANWLIVDWTDDDQLVPLVVLGLAWLTLCVWTMDRLRKPSALRPRVSTTPETPTWLIAVGSFGSAVLAFLAQGGSPDWHPPIRWGVGLWGAAAIGAALLLARIMKPRLAGANAVMLEKACFLVGTLSLIMLTIYSVNPMPWSLMATQVICVLCAVSGVVAAAAGGVQRRPRTRVIGWLGMAMLFVSCGGNLWVTALDPSGAVIANAKVELSGKSYATDLDGEASIPFLPLTPARLRVSSIGFNTMPKVDLALPLFFAKRSVVTLPVGSRDHTGKVTGAASLPSLWIVSIFLDTIFVACALLSGRVGNVVNLLSVPAAHTHNKG